MGYSCCQLGVKNNKVDLLQQTPGDCTIGDLVAMIGGRNFIMEFKRDRKLLDTERKKESRDFLLKDALIKDLLLISVKSHFISFMENGELLVNPYLSLNPKYNPHFTEPYSQNIFFKGLIELEIGVDGNQIKTYTEFLSKNSTVGSASVLVNYLAGRKPLVINMSEGFRLDKKIEMDITNEIKIRRNRSMGMGM